MVETEKNVLYMYLGTLHAGLRYLMIKPTVAGNGWLHWRLTGLSLGPFLPSVLYKNFVFESKNSALVVSILSLVTVLSNEKNTKDTS